MMETDSELSKKLGDRIRMLRVTRRWSQENLAAESGLHRNYVGHIERGEVNTWLTNINKLARAFGMTVSELMQF
jgi:transcriptional regulator with XRE-family HTH domain